MHTHTRQKHRDSTLRHHTHIHTHTHTRQKHRDSTLRHHTHTYTHTSDRKKETAHYNTTQTVKNWQGSIRNVQIGNTQITLHNTPAPVYIVNTQKSTHKVNTQSCAYTRVCVCACHKGCRPPFAPPPPPPLANHVRITVQKTLCVTQL